MLPFDHTYFSNLNLVCRLGGFFQVPPNSPWKHPNHVFEQNKFYYLTEGSCYVTVQDTTYMLNPGDWVFIPANVPHSYASHPLLPMKKYWMHFDIYPDSFVQKIPQLPFMISTGKAESRVTELFSGFVSCFDSQDVAHRLEAKATGIQLLALYLQLAFPDGISFSQGSTEQLQALLSYIQQHLSFPLTNQELANFLHLHPTYFCRWFRERMGLPPQQYLLQRRLDAAKQLLEETDCTVSEIARRVGFQDPAHLSHAFRRHYALSPLKYRTFANRPSVNLFGKD